MIDITEMYRGNEEVFLQQGLKQGIQKGEKITSVKWFLRGRLGFSDLIEELGESKANFVRQNADNFRAAMEKGVPLISILEQLDKQELS